MRRGAAREPGLPLAVLLARSRELLEGIGLIPLDRALLVGGGALDEPGLRSLDAIHVCAAARVAPLDAFVTYDERQAAVSRLAGFRTVSPGA